MTESTTSIQEPVALVTGSTDGVDREIALGLAHKGATVPIHGPDRQKGQPSSTGSIVKLLVRRSCSLRTLLIQKAIKGQLRRSRRAPEPW